MSQGPRVVAQKIAKRKGLLRLGRIVPLPPLRPRPPLPPTLRLPRNAGKAAAAEEDVERRTADVAAAKDAVRRRQRAMPRARKKPDPSPDQVPVPEVLRPVPDPPPGLDPPPPHPSAKTILQRRGRSISRKSLRRKKLLRYVLYLA